MTEIRFEGITKKFGTTVAVDNIDLEINDKEFVVFLGPSGCGKTTMLRMVAGLLDPTDGTIYFDDNDVIAKSPKERNIAMVFQEYSLYPHMTVSENMGLCLKVDKVQKDEITRRVKETAELLEIEDQLEKKPAQLSGGQQQRVALGRAIIREPSVFLMDEPLSNLDAILRDKMRVEIKKLQKNLKTTTIFVTHDQSEAMMLADKIVVMCEGKNIQYATPKEIYRNPKSKFVAEFIGSPSMNFLEVSLVQTNGDNYLDGGDFKVVLNSKEAQALRERSSKTEFVIGIRPHNIEVSLSPKPGFYEVKRSISQLMGKVSYITAEVQGKPITIEIPASMQDKIRDKIYIKFNSKASHVFDSTTENCLTT